MRGFSRRGAYGIRTRAAAVRGRCPRPLDECAAQRPSLAAIRRHPTGRPEHLASARSANGGQLPPYSGRMKRLVALVLVLTALVATSCGGGKSKPLSKADYETRIGAILRPLQEKTL